MKSSASRYATALLNDCKDKNNASIEERVTKFVYTLAATGKSRLFCAIQQEVERLVREHGHHARLTLMTDGSLDEKDIRASSVFSKDVRINVRVITDAAIVSGAVVHTDTGVIDASIRGRLRALRSYLS